jgi:hypothetical protein
VKQKPKKNFGSYMMRLSSSKDAGEGTVIVVNYHTNKDDFKNVRMKNAHESGFVHGSGSKQKHIAVLGEFIGAYPKKLITPVPSPGYIHLEGGHVAFPWIDASRAWALHAAEEKNRYGMLTTNDLRVGSNVTVLGGSTRRTNTGGGAGGEGDGEGDGCGGDGGATGYGAVDPGSLAGDGGEGGRERYDSSFELRSEPSDGNRSSDTYVHPPPQQMQTRREGSLIDDASNDFDAAGNVSVGGDGGEELGGYGLVSLGDLRSNSNVRPAVIEVPITATIDINNDNVENNGRGEYPDALLELERADTSASAAEPRLVTIPGGPVVYPLASVGPRPTDGYDATNIVSAASMLSPVAGGELEDNYNYFDAAAVKGGGVFGVSSVGKGDTRDHVMFAPSSSSSGGGGGGAATGILENLNNPEYLARLMAGAQGGTRGANGEGEDDDDDDDVARRRSTLGAQRMESFSNSSEWGTCFEDDALGLLSPFFREIVKQCCLEFNKALERGPGSYDRSLPPVEERLNQVQLLLRLEGGKGGGSLLCS